MARDQAGAVGRARARADRRLPGRRGRAGLDVGPSRPGRGPGRLRREARRRSGSRSSPTDARRGRGHARVKLADLLFDDEADPDEVIVSAGDDHRTRGQLRDQAEAMADRPRRARHRSRPPRRRVAAQRSRCRGRPLRRLAGRRRLRAAEPPPLAHRARPHPHRAATVAPSYDRTTGHLVRRKPTTADAQLPERRRTTYGDGHRAGAVHVGDHRPSQSRAAARRRTCSNCSTGW